MEKRSKRIGVLGGSFDPVHIGHLRMAELAREEFSLDRVLFLPAYNPPHKEGKGGNVDQRLDMLKMALEGREAFSLDLREALGHASFYSLDSIRAIQKENPQAQLFFLMGEDSLLSIRTWHKYRELLKLAPPIVFARDSKRKDLEEAVASLRKEGFEIFLSRSPALELSSSQIRQDLAQGHLPYYFLDRKVSDYIQKFGLYQGPGQRKDAPFLDLVKKESMDFLDQEPYRCLEETLQKTLKPKRFAHSLRVTQTALALGRHYGMDLDKLRLAALLHDCAKNKEDAYFQQLLDRGLVQEKDYAPSNLFHAKVGSWVAQYFFQVKDPEILNAIAFHTTGRPHMTDLEKVIFLADGIEYGRKYPSVMEIRIQAMDHLDRAVLLLMNRTLAYLLQEGQWIAEESLEARNFLLQEIKKTEEK